MGYEQTSNSHGNAPAEQTRVGSHEVSWPGVCRYEGREGRSNATREAQQRRKTSLNLGQHPHALLLSVSLWRAALRVAGVVTGLLGEWWTARRDEMKLRQIQVNVVLKRWHP